MLALDARGLHEVVCREEISMCGFVPATIMVVAAVARRRPGGGAGPLRQLRRRDRGQGSVVGYAGLVLS